MKKIISHIADLVMQAKVDIEQTKGIEDLDLIRVKYLGKKGHFNKKLIALRDLVPEARPVLGVAINRAKHTIQQALAERKTSLKNATLIAQLQTETLDVSLPGRHIKNGGLHPISCTIAHVEDFFEKLGFSVVNGLEIEDDYHNFDALNIPPHHPARADHDTFRFDASRLLRTHTSGVQIRVMKAQSLPIRIITSGRVYRNDYDKTHTPMFHQMEGLMIDTDINFSNLKSTLYNFLHIFFEKNLQIRFRPSYFPFTKLSAEVDVMKEKNRWVEVLGCGMVHPSVLQNVGINSEIYSGFAFGIGMERLTMLRYGVVDSRAFFENDLRFLKQFK